MPLMKKLTISTYKNPEDESKQRKQTVMMDIDVNDILALTTAGGDNSKWAKLYVCGYNNPLALTAKSCDKINNRLI